MAKNYDTMIIGYFDGSCEPRNPGGIMGLGAFLLENGKQTFKCSVFVPAAPENTNNIAEYLALMNLLDYMIQEELFDKEILIKGDSQLVIGQMSKGWKIKKGAYVEYARSALGKRKQFKKMKFEWIPRDQNSKANQLSGGR